MPESTFSKPGLGNTRIFFAIQKEKKYSQPKGKNKFTTALDEDVIKELKKLAMDLGRSANNLIEEGTRVILDKYKSKPKK